LQSPTPIYRVSLK